MKPKKEEEFKMTDERRMRVSGAEESGYHAPTAQDIDDIRKDHHTHSEPNAVNADAFIRDEEEETEAAPLRSVEGSGAGGDIESEGSSDGQAEEDADEERRALGRRTA